MRQHRSVLAVALCVVAGGAAYAASSQGSGQGSSPQQRPVFRAGTELVQVDVVVRDRSGEPIRGLKADDFVILDRGKPQQITTFTSVQHDRNEVVSFASQFPLTTKLDVSSNRTAQARRLVVLVLDDLHGYRGRDDVVKKIAREVVEQLGSDALMALLMTSGNYNVEITEDRSRLMAAIDRFKGARAVRRPVQAIDDRQGRGAGVQPPGRGQTQTVVRDTGVDLSEFDANLRMYSTLESAARLFSATDGRRKAFVLISENLVKDLGGLLQSQRVTPDAVEGGEAYIAGNLEAKPKMTQPYHDLAVLEAVEALRKSNVVTYAIDPRGEISTQDMLRECGHAVGFGAANPSSNSGDPCMGGESGPISMSSWVRLAQHGLEQLAGASGGFAVVNTNDFTGGIAHVIDDLDNYYLLGFSTEDTKTKGYRRLEVQLKGRRDVQLRYRRGYELGTESREAKVNKDPLFAMLASALPKPNVPLRLTAAALPGSGRDARIPVAIEVTVPRQSLEEADARLRDQIRYAVTVIDMKGSKVKETTGYGARMVLRPRTTGGAPPDSVTYQIGVALSLPPGRYHLRASASSTKLEDGGSVYLQLDVPDFTKEQMAVSALVVGYGSGPRVPAVAGVSPAQQLAARRAGIPPPARGSAEANPGGVPFSPTLDREFLQTDDVVLYFEVARKDRSREVSLDLMAVGRNDGVIREFKQKLPAGSAGKVTVRLPLKEIGPGAFRLRVHASDGVNEADSEVPIVIR